LNRLLTLPDEQRFALTIRAKALLFHDPRSFALLEQVERIARSDATALIIGETGTGKELIARHIHTESKRRGPFIAVNCGAFSESLIDAELFGHETGAFTGAKQARAGWFEAANGGTLFLDEIGDLSLGLQVKLLRVLQERQVVRLGSRKPIPLDVRLVAATNVQLDQAVNAKRFRSDLYYRLSVATIHLPPLYQRPGDILPLAHHFVSVYSDKLKLEGVQISAAAKQALLSYDWPGNIRELENVIHYALIISQNNWIDSDDLRLVGALHRKNSDAGPAAQTPAAVVNSAVVDALVVTPPPEDLHADLEDLFLKFLHASEPDLFERVEALLVKTAFDFSGKNQVQTAKALCITRNMLRTQLKNHGLIGSERDDLPNAFTEFSEASYLAASS
jgi:sigma-54-specific transcriptional regulator